MAGRKRGIVRRDPSGPDVVRDAILAGGGLALLTENGTAELAALYQALAASGRQAELRILDLSHEIRDLGRRGRVGRVAPDLDALVATPFAEDVLAALASAEASLDIPMHDKRFCSPRHVRASLARARAVDPGGPGAWDRVMARCAAEPEESGTVSPAARASRAALVGGAWPDLDGITPTLDLGLALSGGITLVLAGAADEHGTVMESDRQLLAAFALGALFAEETGPGGPAVVMSPWVTQLHLHQARHPDRVPRPLALAPDALRDGGLAVLPDGFPPHRELPARPRATGYLARGAAGTCLAHFAGWDAKALLLDTDGWPCFVSGHAPGGAGVGRVEGGTAARLARDIADGAAAVDAPWGFQPDLPHYCAWGLHGFLGRHTMLDAPAWPGAERDPALSEIDTELVLACEAAGSGSLLHAWVRAGDARRRRQFALAWQGLADLGRRHGLGPAVDAGEESLPLVAAALGLDRARTRRFVGLPFYPGEDLPLLAAVAAALPPDRLPRPGDQPAWESFVAAVTLLAELLPDGRVAAFPPFALAFLERCGRDGWRAGGTIDLHVSFLKDVLRGLLRILEEHDPELPAYRIAASILLDARDLHTLDALSRAWHADPVLRVRGSLSLSPDACWPRLFEGDVPLGGGYAARALGTLRELVAEGDAGPDEEGRPGLDHCVAGYAEACLAGECAIVSIRGPDGNRVSTAEIVERRGVQVVTQHRARGNAGPPPEAIMALERLERMLREGTIRVRDPHEPVEADPVAGTMPETLAREIRDDVARRWGRILPGRRRVRDHEALLAVLLDRGQALEPEDGCPLRPGMVA